MIQYALGKKNSSDAALARLIEIAVGDWAYGIASVYAFRAESDRAFAWLERAYELKDVDLGGVKGDPILQNIQHDPRYSAFLRKMNLPE